MVRWTLLRVFVGVGAAAAAAAPTSVLQGAPPPNSVLLQGATQPGVYMPLLGLGTAGGNQDYGFGSYPECWNSCHDSECNFPVNTSASCAKYAEAAIAVWLQLGGRRLDSANSYGNQDSVGRAMRSSSVPRSEQFLTTKTGSGNPLGFNETLAQVRQLLNATGLTFADNVMLHWPSCETGGGCQASTDPACDWGQATYDDAGCRLSSYRGLLAAMSEGLTRSVGVSNFNVSHLQELAAAGLPAPALNQISFSLYHSAPELPLLAYCRAHGIVVNSWCPLQRPDHWVHEPPCAPTPVTDPRALAVAAKLGGGATAAQVQLAWQLALGVLPTPRSQNVVHMQANLRALELAARLSADDLAALGAAPQALCEPSKCTNPVVANEYPQGTCAVSYGGSAGAGVLAPGGGALTA